MNGQDFNMEMITLYNRAEKHLRKLDKSSPEIDGLRQQKTRLDSSPFSQEQESETSVGTGSPSFQDWKNIV